MTKQSSKTKVIIKGSVLIKNAPNRVLLILRKELTHDNPAYKQAKKNGYIPEDLPKYVHYFKNMGSSAIIVPKGMLRRVLQLLDFDPKDVMDFTVSPEIDLEFKGILRDYQDDAVRDILPKRYGILSAPTGAGKTISGTYMTAARGLRTLVIVHNKELFQQWQEAFLNFTDIKKENIGLIGAGKYSIGDVTIGIINSVAKHADELKNEFGFVIGDECFPAGTLVDGVPIENIQVGDRVHSFNHLSQNVERRAVTHVFKNKVNDELLTITLSNGATITCTPKHPFLTENGYLTADQLLLYSTVYTTDHTTKGGYDERMHLPKMSSSSRSERTIQGEAATQGMSNMQTDKGEKINNSSLQSMQNPSYTNTLQSKTGWCTLFGQMCASYNEKEQKEVRCMAYGVQQEALQRTHEKEQPSIYAGSISKNRKHQTCQWHSERMDWQAWWERAANPTTREGSNCFGVEDGSCCVDGSAPTYSKEKHGVQKETQIPNSLQNRRSQQGVTYCNRNRREGTLKQAEPNAGCKKGSVLKEAWVVSIEVHKRTSGQQFESLCRDGFVYNIEVESNHNYFVESTLVHNCHRAVSDTWVKVINTLRPQAFTGLSATPYRSDGLTKALFQIVGPLLHKVDRKHLEKTGAILVPRVIKVNTQFDYNFNNDYSTMLSTLAKDQRRNVLIANTLINEFKRYKEPIMIVSDRVAHCDALYALLNGQVGLKPVVVHGKLKKDIREAAIQGLRDGKYNAVIATVALLGEGFDLPELNAIALCTPLKFSGRLLQVIGRGIRPSKGGQPRVYDFRDNLVKTLRYTGFHRNKVYEQMDWD